MKMKCCGHPVSPLILFCRFVFRKKLKRGNNCEPQKTFENITWTSIVSRVGVTVEHCKRLDKGKFKGIPSYFFQHFFEIAKSTFKVKEKKLYCTLMCKKCVTFHKSNKKIKFYS